MKLFAVTSALLMGLALGLPVADKEAIKIQRPKELLSRLAARYDTALPKYSISKYQCWYLRRLFLMCNQLYHVSCFRLSSAAKHHLLHTEGGSGGGHNFHVDRQQNFEIAHDGKSCQFSLPTS